MSRLKIAISALLLLTLSEQARAEMRALLMGFDTYASKQTLTGSRNDVADLARALQSRGVEDVTLAAQDATRAEVEAAWEAMKTRARPGDVLFVSFSGNGNHLPEEGEPKHQLDGFEKGFLLPLYDEEQHPEEVLRDGHLYDLFKVACDEGLKVIFVGDAAHTGSSTRDIRPPGAPPFKYQRFEAHGRPYPSPPTPSEVVRRPALSCLNSYSAADEDQTVLEFTLDGQRRGVLSYVVARGLEKSTVSSSNVLTQGDLARYVFRNVRLLSEDIQHPSIVTPDPDLVLFDEPDTRSR